MALRVDKWLWAVRAYKTRTSATEGCKSGRVLLNGVVAKPASKVVVGDVVEARLKERTVIYKVVALLEKRVGAAVAAEAFEDQSPPPESSTYVPVVPHGRRERGQGRPTKRERRDIQKLRGRDE